MLELRVVVDTNVFISGLILLTRYPNQVIALWQERSIQVVVSRLLIDEILAILQRPKIRQKYGVTTTDCQVIVQLLERYAFFQESIVSSEVSVRDPKDQFLLDLALTSQADYLITGDEDLLILASNEQMKPLKIVSPKDFVLTCSN